MRIAELGGPLFVSWQLTRDCNLACLHCCTDSAPGRALPGELSRDEALRLARQIVAAEVPYVMLCGGEPLIVEHFFEVAEALGRGGVELKVESNGQLLYTAEAERLATLPIRSAQISLDGDTQEIYAKQRPGGSLAKAHAACRAIRAARLPLEVTFAPTRINIHEAEAVMDRALSLGAFRFNTGSLMRLGTAAKLWERLEPAADEYEKFLELLRRKERELDGWMEVCYRPFSLIEGMREALSEPPATLLVLPDGKVKVSAPLPYVCADLRERTLAEAWEAYRRAWEHPAVKSASKRILEVPAALAEANRWQPLWCQPPNELTSCFEGTSHNSLTR